MTAALTPAYVLDMDGALLNLELDIEDVRLRLAALFGPYGITRPFRPILPRILAAAHEAGGDEAALRRDGLGSASSRATTAAKGTPSRPAATSAGATAARARLV